jgi:hypothetical protein
VADISSRRRRWLPEGVEGREGRYLGGGNPARALPRSVGSIGPPNEVEGNGVLEEVERNSVLEEVEGKGLLDGTEEKPPLVGVDEKGAPDGADDAYRCSTADCMLSSVIDESNNMV